MRSTFIDDTPGIVAWRIPRARRLKREHDLGLIVIDYPQLMQVPGNKENRATEISEICVIKGARQAKLNIPGSAALLQLNHRFEQTHRQSVR